MNVCVSFVPGMKVCASFVPGMTICVSFVLGLTVCVSFVFGMKVCVSILSLAQNFGLVAPGMKVHAPFVLGMKVCVSVDPPTPLFFSVYFYIIYKKLGRSCVHGHLWFFRRFDGVLCLAAKGSRKLEALERAGAWHRNQDEEDPRDAGANHGHRSLHLPNGPLHLSLQVCSLPERERERERHFVIGFW